MNIPPPASHSSGCDPVPLSERNAQTEQVSLIHTEAPSPLPAAQTIVHQNQGSTNFLQTSEDPRERETQKKATIMTFLQTKPLLLGQTDFWDPDRWPDNIQLVKNHSLPHNCTLDELQPILTNTLCEEFCTQFFETFSRLSPDVVESFKKTVLEHQLNSKTQAEYLLKSLSTRFQGQDLNTENGQKQAFDSIQQFIESWNTPGKRCQVKLAQDCPMIKPFLEELRLPQAMTWEQDQEYYEKLNAAFNGKNNVPEEVILSTWDQAIASITGKFTSSKGLVSSLKIRFKEFADDWNLLSQSDTLNQLPLTQSFFNHAVGYLKKIKQHNLPRTPEAFQQIEALEITKSQLAKTSSPSKPKRGPIATAFAKFFSFSWLVTACKKLLGSFQKHIKRNDTQSLSTDDQEKYTTLGILEGHYMPQTTSQNVHTYGTFLSSADISTFLTHLQHVQAPTSKAILEYESGAISILDHKLATSPMSYLKEEKIYALQEQAKKPANKRVLYAIPYVFAGKPVDHITSIVIDFVQKQIIYFDSKGHLVADVDRVYSQNFNFKTELEKMGQLCFGSSWNPTQGIKDQSRHLQYSGNDCGRWVMRHIETMVESPTPEECQTRLHDRKSPDGKPKMTIDAYGRSVAATLNDPETTKTLNKKCASLATHIDPSQLSSTATTQHPSTDVDGYVIG